MSPFLLFSFLFFLVPPAAVICKPFILFLHFLSEKGMVSSPLYMQSVYILKREAHRWQEGLIGGKRPSRVKRRQQEHLFIGFQSQAGRDEGHIVICIQ